MDEPVKILIAALENIALDSEDCTCESFKTATNALIDYSHDVRLSRVISDKFSVTTFNPK